MVQRYDVDSPSVCFEAEDGHFVKYEDYAALERKCLELEASLLKLNKEIISYVREDMQNG